MTLNADKYFIFIFMLVPIFLITGPAIPDLIISFCAIFFLFSFLIFKKDYVFL